MSKDVQAPQILFEFIDGGDPQPDTAAFGNLVDEAVLGLGGLLTRPLDLDGEESAVV